MQLTWVASGALGESVGQVGQLAHMVTVLQGTHVHVVPPAKLTEPEALLLGFGVGVQHDAHPQRPCRDTHVQAHNAHSCSSAGPSPRYHTAGSVAIFVASMEL